MQVVRQSLRRLVNGLIIILCLGANFVPSLVFGFTLGFDPDGSLQAASQLGTQDPAYIVYSVINTGLIFLGLITLVMIVVAGFMWLLAAGEEEKIEKAKDILKGSVLGLVVVLSSFGLARFVFTAIQIAVTGANS